MRYFGHLGKLEVSVSDDDRAMRLLAAGYDEYPSPPPEPNYTFTNGEWIAPATPTLSLAAQQQQALRDVDTAAAKLDAKYLTVGGMQGAVYRIKEEQARAYKAANYPALAEPLADPDPNFIAYGHVRQYRETLRLTNTGATDQTAADAIIAQADQMVRLSIARERRLTFKQQIRDATTAAQAQAARDVALAELGAL